MEQSQTLMYYKRRLDLFEMGISHDDSLSYKCVGGKGRGGTAIVAGDMPNHTSTL